MTVEQFTALTTDIPYVARGMFYSELYLFTRTCLEQGVARVIESGVRGGMSTRVLRALWPGRLQSVELKPFKCPEDLRTEIIKGDGRDLLPGLVIAHGSTPLGILLDGPKGPKGDALRAVCFSFPHVRVVAQHDSPMGRGETTHSADVGFRRAIGDALDARIDAAIRARYPLGCPGLGVWTR